MIESRYLTFTHFIANIMRHTCTRCNKTYPSIVSLSRHAAACRKKWLRSDSPRTMPLAEEPESSRGRKRPRIRGADEDDEEQAGPSQADSSAHEEVCYNQGLLCNNHKTMDFLVHSTCWRKPSWIATPTCTVETLWTHHPCTPFIRRLCGPRRRITRPRTTPIAYTL